MQKEKTAEKKSFFSKIRTALMPKNKKPGLLSQMMEKGKDPALVIEEYAAKYSDGGRMSEKDAARLAKEALCSLMEQKQGQRDAGKDNSITKAMLDVHKETNGSGPAIVATAKAAMKAATEWMPAKNIEETLKSMVHIAHYTKSVDATISCAETASLYEGDGAHDVAGTLFSVILPYRYSEKPKEIVMRASAFLRDKEVMAMVEGSPFLLEIAAYTSSKPAMWKCISLGADFFPVSGIPPYVRLGIEKVARATRLGEEVVRWVGLISNHITKGKINDRLMILLLCQFGVQAGDAIPNHMYDRGISGAAESGKKLLGEIHETFFREFADCVL